MGDIPLADQRFRHTHLDSKVTYMKLKAPGNRAYNIFFHLHTVSGLIMTAALFVIFFAGAFTLFKSEIFMWSDPVARNIAVKHIDPLAVLEHIADSIPDFDIDDETAIIYPTSSNPKLTIHGHIKREGEPEIHYTREMHPLTFEIDPATAATIGETLYRLHFLDQIPLLGRWIAGFVSLFFILSVITGLLVHWKNMVNKFWGFVTKGSWKRIWTNSHTVFGLIGLPYQLMYAVTGAFYLLLFLALMPMVLVFFEGDPEKVYGMAFPSYQVEYAEDAAVADYSSHITHITEKVQKEYGEAFHILAVQTRHLYKEDGAVNYILQSKDPALFSSFGHLAYRLSDGSELYNEIPQSTKQFRYEIIEAIQHLHFASFGGVFVKVLYFILALFTCFVIISGLLIWKEARNNKRYTDQQRRFHHRYTMANLSLCLGLFPAVAVLFMAELMVAGDFDEPSRTNLVFFSSWLLFTLLGYFLNADEKRLTRMNLLVGGILSLCVALTNGILTSDWFFLTDTNDYVAYTDISWIMIGLLSIGVGIFSGKAKQIPISQMKQPQGDCK